MFDRSLAAMLMAGLRASAAVAALAVAPAAMAQEVTSNIRGEVTDDQGNPLQGATVNIVHVPSGTRSAQTTDARGSFDASNLRIGGPYSVTVALGGFDTAETTIASLQAGQPQRITVFLLPAGATIDVVGVRAVRSSIQIASGPATSLNQEEIARIANVNRDVRNLINRDAFATLDPTNAGAISIAGQNNRFNRITVDGIEFGDPFGLEAGGLASARGPVPLDAIGELTVEVAPADIQQGGFQGGAVNTVLLSGANRFTGTGFYSYTSDDLAGSRTRSTPQNPDGRIDRTFESRIWGAQVTGPIIPDRLFFAVTFERLRDTTPALVGIPGEGFGNAIQQISRAQVTQVQQIAQSVYNFEAGDIAQNVPENDDKLVVKLDWNIAPGHRAAFTYIWSEGDLLAGQTGAFQVAAASPILSLQSNNYTQGTINHYGVFQLNNEWTDSFSTQTRISYNDYERLQVPFGAREFGQFQVCLEPAGSPPPLVCPTGTGRINFGPDISRQANQLFVETLGVEFQAQLRRNNHNVKLIAERRQRDFNNLFAQRVSGQWYFDSLADLQARRANEVQFATPVQGDIDTVRALFTNTVWTFGVQDVWDVAPDLSVVFGARYDLYESGDNPQVNQAFFDRYGFTNSSSLNGRGVLQPRFAAIWSPVEGLRLRGTAGLFAGGNPNVWISNNYSNPGPLLASSTVRRVPGVGGAADTFTISDITGLTPAEVQALGAAVLNNVSGGTGVPEAFLARLRGAGPALATTNALDPDFRLPSQWRVSGTVEYVTPEVGLLGALGADWRVGADVVWSRVKDALTWTDLRSVPNTVQATLPDGRPRYQAFVPGSNNQDMLLTNTDRGYSWNIVGRLNKEFASGFFLGGSYTWQRVRDVNPGTSSVALSNYNNAANLDPNNAAFGISNYQRDNAIRAFVGLQREFIANAPTRVELFFNSLAGQRFSYTMQDTTAGRSAVFGTTGTNTRYLLYVPNVGSPTADPIVTYAPTFNFPAFQQFVQNSVLADRQGSIANKNIGRSPRFNKLDLSVSQGVPFFLGSRFELFADFENVLNLIDRDLGSLRQVSFPYFAPTVNVACEGVTSVGAPCTRYVYANFREPNETLFTNVSLWQVRLGARFSF